MYKQRSFLAAAACLGLVGAVAAWANVSGAIYTTNSTGTQVNGNIYASKDAVYLSGGPQNTKDPGLVPDGLYYFQVTDPSGAVLLSTDDITCRQVQVINGRVAGVPTGTPANPPCLAGAYHAVGTHNDANEALPVQLIPYNDTPNPGGEYKAWMTPVANYNRCSSTKSNVTFGFCDSDSKTDNFKVKKPGVAYISVCKFNDLNGNGIQDTADPFIPGWPITATGVDSVSGTKNTTVTAQTDAAGCVSFSVSDIAIGSTRTVTLTEGTLGVDWAQTAPGNGIYDANGNSAGSGPTTVSGAVPVSGVPAAGGTISVVLSPGDSVTAPNFGNTNPNCNTATACGGTSLVVTKNANPSNTFTWTIQKAVDKTEIDSAATTAIFNYTVTVTHDSGTGWIVTGNISVSNPTPADITATITDALPSATCTITDTTGGINELIEAGESISVPYSCTYPAGDMPAAGTNTATATWSATTTYAAGQTSGTAPVDFKNAVIDGSVTVTDTLGGTLGTVSYTDPSPTTFMYSHTVAGTPGTCVSQNNTASFTTSTTHTPGSDSKTVKFCEGADLTVSKTAVPSYNYGISKSGPASPIRTSSLSTELDYTVTVTESGWQVAGNITVTNPNDWEDISVGLSDAVSLSGATCTITGGNTQTVNRSSSISPSYTCTFSSAPSAANGTNSATATWSASSYSTPDGSASFTTPTFTFASLTVTDTFNGASSGKTLGIISTPATSTTFNDSYTPTSTRGTCTTYSNTASVGDGLAGHTSSQSVQVCVGADLTVSKTATPSYTYGISKTSNQISPVRTSSTSNTLGYTVTVTESGWQVAGNITVTNPNDWEDISVGLSDAVSLSGATCTITGGNTQTVNRSSSISPSYTCTFSSAPSAGNGTNSATATWSASSYSTPDGSASFTTPTFTFASLTVTDTFNGGAPATLGTISTPTASTTYNNVSYSTTTTAGTCHTYPNIATAAVGTTSKSSEADVQVCVGADLTVSKTATPAYLYSINKVSNQTSPVESAGSSTLRYTVQVTESGWNVSGNITVTNPNTWEDIPVTLSDVLSLSGAPCSIVGGNTQMVNRSSSISPAYSCMFAAAPGAASGTNSVTASWNATTFATPDGSKSYGPVGFTFAPLTVVDTFNGGTPKTLGTIVKPAALTSYADSYSVTPSPGTCVVYPNTATAGSQQANVSVTACNTATGALTMGFWQNKNGQGIITGGASTSGVCNSGTWLRQYVPFQDLSATATCAQVGTYITNIIKVATASGTAMNAMLKAQMLATALDVYFSDSSRGGNQISAAIPIGGVKIDLTRVCAMIDGSGGTASCSGSTENASAAFGGATSLTVSQILAYAASQSNVGGSVWYGQIKTTQELAKNTFDAINNQAAPIAP